MSVNSRPGIYISEVVQQSITIPDTPSDAYSVFVGPTYSGPTQDVVGVPTRITSWKDFTTIFGGFNDVSLATPYAVWHYFNNGGNACLVSRVIPVAATASSVTVPDRAATAQSTLSFTAMSEGVWGTNLKVQVIARSTTPDVGRFDLRVYLGGTAAANIVESWIDLSMVASDLRYVANIINSQTAGSNYVKVVDLNSPTTPPSDAPLVGTYSLSGGTAGSLAASDWNATIDNLDMVEHAITFNLPGKNPTSDPTVISHAITYAEGRGDAFLVVDPSSGLSVAQAVAEQGTLPQTSYAAYYYPWLYMIDPSNAATVTASKLTAPGGAVMGVIASIDHTVGAFQAPAGLRAKVAGAFNLERKFTTADLDTLNNAYVNAIRNHPIGGICIFGARTFARTSALRYVPVRRNLIFIKDNVQRLVSPYVFENNDETTWTSIEVTVANFLINLWSEGGLTGVTADQGFYVICDGTTNTPATIDAGELHVQVGVALESPAEFIVINIGQWQGGSTAFEA